MKLISRRQIAGFMGAGVLAMLTAACATTSSSSAGQWEEPRSGNAPYETVLVVSTIPATDVRRAFDQTLAGIISKGGAKGVSGFALSWEMDESRLSRELVIAMAEKSGADAIIVTKIIGQSGHVGTSRERVAVKYNPGLLITQSEDGSMSSVMASEYWIETTDSTSTMEGDVMLGTYLYERGSGDKLIYQAVAQGNFRLAGSERVEGVAQDMAMLIAKQLKSDKVIR